MLNYLIIIVAWSAWLLLCLAFSLSHTLAKAFRDPATSTAPAPSPAPATLSATADSLPSASTSTTPASRVLGYAPVAPRRMPLFRRRPWLAGAAEMLGYLLGQFPVSATIFVWWRTGMFQPHAVVAMVVGPVALVLALLLVRRGLRRIDGVPAAVHWPRRKFKIAFPCGLLALVLLVALLSWITQCRLQRIDAQMAAQSQRLYIPVPAGMTNAADVYARAFKRLDDLPRGSVDWWGRCSSGSDIPGPPPVLSRPEQAAVSIMLGIEAARLPVADWGESSQACSPLATPPHPFKLRRAAGLLRIHAVQQAQAGRMDLAMIDLRALRAMARHAAQGQSLLEGIIANGMDECATRAIEDVLPFIREARQLDDLPFQDAPWYRAQRQRMFQGEQAGVVRTMTAAYQGDTSFFKATGSTGSTGSVASVATISFYRPFVAEADVIGCKELLDELAALAGQDPAAAIPRLRQLQAQWPQRCKSAGALTMLLTPTPAQVEQADSAEIHSQFQRVGLAAKRFHLRTGHFPGSLDELVSAGLLDRVPTDPYSGKPILMEDQGDELIIYSVGPKGAGSARGTLRNRYLTFRVGLRPLWEIDREAYDRDNPTSTSTSNDPSAPATQPTSLPVPRPPDSLR